MAAATGSSRTQPGGSEAPVSFTAARNSEGFGSQESNHLITGSRPPGRLQTEGLFQSHCRDKSHALGVSVFAVKATMEGRTVRRPRSR